MGRLYLVSTPIGNLQDISQRALDTLKDADLVACEDTRHTGMMLARYQIKNNLISYHDYNEQQRIPEIIDKLLNGQNIALVSDAGTPLVSDPGYKLIRSCIENNIPIIAIPGPTAAIAALTVSGLPTDKFLFLGFLPKSQGKRQQILKNTITVLQSIKVTIIIYEAPHRLIKTLTDMRDVMGDIDIVICRELTKLHEEVRREKISTVITHFQNVIPKGEFTVLV